MHIPGGDDPYQGSIRTQREGNVQPSAIVGFAECMEARFPLAMSVVAQHDERLVENGLLGFSLANAVLIRALAGVAFIPVESGDPPPVDHLRIFP